MSQKAVNEKNTVRERRGMKCIKGVILLLCIAIMVLLASCGENAGHNEQSKLVVFHAGSLSVPFKKMVTEFNKENPDVKVLLESAGSRACARKISDLKRPCDVMASADYTVIDKLLIPEHAKWNLKFATNEMAIAYHPDSRRAAEFNKNNWYNILADKNVIFGRSDPNSDPCGYRSVLTIKLASEFYNDNSINDILLKKNLNYIRPKETDLLALLESHDIDYLFIYRSVAEQHGLKCLLLPDEINLKTTEKADFYKRASLQISGKKPGEFITKTGAPMVYGITIPENAQNREMALKFVEFVLSKEKGMSIMAEMGQPSAIPSACDSYDKLPESLKQFATPVK